MILVFNTCSARPHGSIGSPLFATLRVARANASQWDTPSKSLKGGLRDVWLKAWIQRAKALGKTVFIILDCCHSSNMSRGVGGEEEKEEDPWPLLCSGERRPLLTHHVIFAGEEEKEEDLVSSRCAIPPWLEPPSARSRGLLGDDEPAARWDPDEEMWVTVQEVDCGWDLHTVANR